MPAGEIAPVGFCEIFVMSILLGPNLGPLSWIRCVVTLVAVIMVIFAMQGGHARVDTSPYESLCSEPDRELNRRYP